MRLLEKCEVECANGKMERVLLYRKWETQEDCAEFDDIWRKDQAVTKATGIVRETLSVK